MTKILMTDVVKSFRNTKNEIVKIWFADDFYSKAKPGQASNTQEADKIFVLDFGRSYGLDTSRSQDVISHMERIFIEIAFTSYTANPKCWGDDRVVDRATFTPRAQIWYKFTRDFYTQMIQQYAIGIFNGKFGDSILRCSEYKVPTNKIMRYCYFLVDKEGFYLKVVNFINNLELISTTSTTLSAGVEIGMEVIPAILISTFKLDPMKGYHYVSLEYCGNSIFNSMIVPFIKGDADYIQQQFDRQMPPSEDQSLIELQKLICTVECETKANYKDISKFEYYAIKKWIELLGNKRTVLERNAAKTKTIIIGTAASGAVGLVVAAGGIIALIMPPVTLVAAGTLVVGSIAGGGISAVIGGGLTAAYHRFFRSSSPVEEMAPIPKPTSEKMTETVSRVSSVENELRRRNTGFSDARADLCDEADEFSKSEAAASFAAGLTFWQSFVYHAQDAAREATKAALIVQGKPSGSSSAVERHHL